MIWFSAAVGDVLAFQVFPLAYTSLTYWFAVDLSPIRVELFFLSRWRRNLAAVNAAVRSILVEQSVFDLVVCSSLIFFLALIKCTPYV